MKKSKKLMIIGYLLFSAISFFYVRSVLKTEEVGLYKKEDERKIQKQYDVNVTLIYFNGKNNIEFKTVVKNSDSAEKLLKDTRSHENISMEFDEYTYGMEILSVQGVIPKSGYKWALIQNGEDITLNMKSTAFSEDTVLELKIVKR